MADLVPAGPASAALTPLDTSPLTRLRSIAAQPAVRRALPVFLGLAALGGAALAWSALAPSPQRVLYSELSDGERASVTAALDKAGVGWTIDNQTGSLTVDEGDLYRARMLVASDGALAVPESGAAALDSLPLGASRTLEGERLRAAREQDLVRTIMEIDGVEAVRVHLAEAEKSVFVREDTPPTASVMLRMARGRTLSEGQVSAIVNLVAGSVPGLSPDAVRVVDQHGRLLSDRTAKDSDRLELQSRMEAKLRAQVEALLAPMVGRDAFTSEVQVELDMDEVTTARENYGKDGVVRSETQAQATTPGAPGAVGVPGVLSNTPPPATTVTPGAPQGTPGAATTPAQAGGESSATRTYELNREVAVASTSPGKIKRLSVAVALSQKAMAKAKPQDIEQIKQLVTAAVGADPARGDQVAVAVRAFEPTDLEPPAFYEAPWFASIVRSVLALLAVLLVLLLAVRPLIKALKRDPAAAAGSDEDGELDENGDPVAPAIPGTTLAAASAPAAIDAALLGRQVGLAQRIAAEKPDSAVLALRKMLEEQPAEEPAQ